MKHVYLRFKRSKSLKGCFYLWITLIKKTTRVHMGNQINTVVFMICLKKELLRAYASSSSISVLCVITLWQRSNAWSEDTFKQHVLRSSYQTKIWLIAHIPKPAVGSPLEHGCQNGKFGIVSTFPSDHTTLILDFGLDRLNHSIRDKSLNWLGGFFRALNIEFFPIPKNHNFACTVFWQSVSRE
jgi:hypothetical protein